jgi:hypothetical protein
VLDKHDNSNKENPRNREPGCIYTIEYANSESSSLFFYNPSRETVVYCQSRLRYCYKATVRRSNEQGRSTVLESGGITDVHQRTGFHFGKLAKSQDCPGCLSIIVGEENTVKVWIVPPGFPTVFDKNHSFFLFFSDNSSFFCGMYVFLTYR